MGRYFVVMVKLVINYSRLITCSVHKVEFIVQGAATLSFCLLIANSLLTCSFVVLSSEWLEC